VVALLEEMVNCLPWLLDAQGENHGWPVDRRLRGPVTLL
jgi:hypothetical protein